MWNVEFGVWSVDLQELSFSALSTQHFSLPLSALPPPPLCLYTKVGCSLSACFWFLGDFFPYPRLSAGEQPLDIAAVTGDDVQAPGGGK